MAALNEQYRGKTGATDVLSFGNESIESFAALRGRGEFAEGLALAEKRGVTDLGDVVLCRELISPQEHWTENDRQVLVHGMVHLLGYDHENVPAEDVVSMERREEELLSHLQQVLGVAGSLPSRIKEKAEALCWQIDATKNPNDSISSGLDLDDPINCLDAARDSGAVLPPLEQMQQVLGLGEDTLGANEGSIRNGNPMSVVQALEEPGTRWAMNPSDLF